MTDSLEYPELMYEESTGDYEIRLYPNPALQEVCEPVAANEFGPEIERLGNQMIALMNQHAGLGLSAPQIGLLKRIFVMKFPLSVDGLDPQPPAILCNPTLELGQDGYYLSEGCLSLPGIYEQVWRARETLVTYQEPLTGETRRMVCLGLESRIVQHEVDHLDGMMFFQRMSRNLRKGVLRAWGKQQPTNLSA